MEVSNLQKYASIKEYAKIFNICQYGTATPCIYGCPKCKSEETISELCDNDCTTLTCSDCKSQYYKFHDGQNKFRDRGRVSEAKTN